jgi:hypothetical protein
MEVDTTRQQINTQETRLQLKRHHPTNLSLLSTTSLPNEYNIIQRRDDLTSSSTSKYRGGEQQEQEREHYHIA